MKQKYCYFIGLLNNDNIAEAKKWFNALSPIEAGTIVFMSQRSASSEHHQLVGDFILRHYGDCPERGVIRMWA